MRYIASILILLFTLIITACSGSDVASSINLYDYPGDEDGRLVIDPDDFEMEFLFDFDPRNASTECRFEDDDWFSCESPYRFTQDSEEHDLEEGYLNFEVRTYQEDDTSSPDQVELLVLFDFDFAIDDTDEYEPGSTETSFYFPDEYMASCSRGDCEINCSWDAEGLDGLVDAGCSLDDSFILEFPDEDLEHAHLLVEGCATDFGGDQGDEHCLGPKTYLFYPPPPAFMTVESGGRHTCGLVEDGSLWCWGRNNAGQVGIDDSTNSIYHATKVVYRNWEMVSAGADHTCAINSSDELYCWGSNASDQLGFEPINPSQPEKVDDRSWLTVSAGSTHTCAIEHDDGLFCWGSNEHGQLGNTAASSGAQMWNVALDATAISEWISVSAGDQHTCAIAQRRTGGEAAYCWGSNLSDQIGSGGGSDGYATPQEVDILNNWDTEVISAGIEHTCAVATLGATRRSYCWGEGSEGRLGTDTGNQSWPIPEQTEGGNDHIDISAGDEHSCALHEDGTVYCWGENIRGQLGTDGDQVDLPTPVASPEGVLFSGVTVGDEHSCAVDDDGFIYCWGRAADGRLGVGEGISADIPTLISWPQGEFVPTPHADDDE